MSEVVFLLWYDDREVGHAVRYESGQGRLPSSTTMCDLRQSGARIQSRFNDVRLLRCVLCEKRVRDHQRAKEQHSK